MAIFRQSQYKFKINDADYISALTTFVSDLQIEGLKIENLGSDLSLEENTKIKDLPQLIEKIKAQPEYLNVSENENIEITLTTRSFVITESLMNVLPKFVPQEIMEENPQLSSAAKGIHDYIGYYTNLYNLDVWVSFPSLPPLTREEAWKALHLAYKQSPFLSAIDLPSKSCIMGLTTCGTKTFMLFYGSERRKIESGPLVGFDVDDGFIPDSSVSPIPNELTTAFNKWKKNKRKGPVLENPMANVADSSNIVEDDIPTNSSQTDDATQEDKKEQSHSTILGNLSSTIRSYMDWMGFAKSPTLTPHLAHTMNKKKRSRDDEEYVNANAPEWKRTRVENLKPQ